ncbi:MAG: EAL domain-containing protein [Rhodanobacteraceae bacterium]
MNALKTICIGWLLSGLIATPVACAAAPAPATPAVIRVVTDNNYPPYVFMGADGKPQGYEVDMWRLFQAHTGIKVELDPMSWDAAQRTLLSGDADVIDLIYRTPSREKLYDFSAPYASNLIAIYVDRRIRGVHDVASLRGLPVGVERGDACVDQLQADGITDLHEFTNYRDIIHAATDGDLRIFCMDESPASYYLYRYSKLDRFYKAFVLYTGHVHRAVRKGDAAMLQTVERGMALVTPAERETLRKRWLDQPVALWPYVRKAEIALAIVLALIALMTLWVWSLRRTVAGRTRKLQAEQAKLRALFDASPDAMTVKDRQGVYVDCNAGAVKYFGVDRDKLLGHTSREVMSAASGDKVHAMDEEVMRLGQPHTYVTSFGSDAATTRKYELVKVPLHASNGAPDGMLTVARDVTERLEADAKLRLWAHAFQHAGFGMEICDSRTKRIIAVNPTFARERGYAPEEMIGMSVDALYPDDIVARQQRARLAMEEQEHALLETEHLTRDGRRFPVLLDCSVVHDADGKAQYAIVYAQDISGRKQADRELRLAAAAFQTQEALMVLDAGHAIQRVNHAFTRLTGYAPDDVFGKPPSLLAAKQSEPALRQAMWEQLHRTGFWQGEHWLQPRQGQPKVVRATLSAVTDAAGATSHFVCSMIDLTIERMAHASIDHMTFFDPLTDLPNRYFLQGRLQHLLDEAGESSGGALLMIDLDHFKRINDLRGHAAGDRLLALFAQRLRDSLDERCVLCRFSGGTFALLNGYGPGDDEAHLEQAWTWAERVRQILREPFPLGSDAPVAVTVSIGWTGLLPGQGTPDSVLKEAELAMYAAKSGGRDQVHRFEPALQIDLLRREALIQDLRDAVANGELELHLQPQADRAGRITGAEALLRWTRPSGEAVSPAVFIPVAEESGLILPIGNWVLERACAQLAAWAREPLTRELNLAVNVSARQFDQSGFVEKVRQILAATGAKPEHLKLEITETAILGDLTRIAGRLARLRAHGIGVALDDFGTGYSSLAYLSRLPLDQLKIDQSFVARLPDSPNDAMVAQTIVAMGHGLSMEVIAEGVETQAQRDFLMARGCDAFQGYLIARPMPLAAFETLLRDAHPTPV